MKDKQLPMFKVYNIETKKTVNYSTINRVAKMLGIDRECLLTHIKHSKTYPILDSYVVTVRRPKELGASADNDTTIYVHDTVDNKWYKYLNSTQVSYHLSIDKTLIDKELKREGPLFRLGYLITLNKDSHKPPRDISKAYIFKERRRHIGVPCMQTNYIYKLRNSETKEIKELKGIDALASFLTELPPRNIVISSDLIKGLILGSKPRNSMFSIKGYILLN